MEIADIVDEIRLELTGGVLELEIEDATIKMLINKALREVERYFDETRLITVPFASCIDLKDFNSSAVTHVYRAIGVGNVENKDAEVMSDPLYMQQYMIFSNAGTMYNLKDYVLNLASYNTVRQIQNTNSTDMSFYEDKQARKLYINNNMSNPGMITIEYIPKLLDVSDISTDYWIDVLIKLSVALTKIAVGRIRTRFTQSNALWAQDGDKLLEEGNTELKELRETLRNNDNLIVGLD